jgi:hypothetical protein
MRDGAGIKGFSHATPFASFCESEIHRVQTSDLPMIAQTLSRRRALAAGSVRMLWNIVGGRFLSLPIREVTFCAS